MTGSTKHSKLKAYLSTFGPINQLVVLTSNEKKEKHCLGFAYALCGDLETKHRLLSHDHYFEGRKIQVRAYKDGSKLKQLISTIHNSKLYLGNIPQEVSDEELSTHFRQFGELESCYQIRDKDTSKGL